jgi:chemotaxis protein methyltransferase CheR
MMGKTLNSKTVSTELHTAIKVLEGPFVQLIKARLGIVMQQHQLKDLERVIAQACDKFNCTPHEYYTTLTNATEQSEQLSHLVTGVTVGETYFFRDKKQMEFLQFNLLPEMISKKRQQRDFSFRIWSAGCSSGEEIYTLAIMLDGILPDIKNWNISLLGTDINTAALQKAMRGRYSEWSMRNVNEAFKSSFFNKENNEYELIAKIREMVTYEYLNLNEDRYPSIFNGTNAQDIIICRNVMIYFDNDIINVMMKKLGQSLLPEGYLILGASDPVAFKNSGLFYHHEKGLVFSREKAPEVKPKPQVKQTPEIKPYRAPKPEIKKVTVNEERITQLLNDAAWEEALKLIEFYELQQLTKTVFLLNAKANALANLGKLPQALRLLTESQAMDSTNKHSYFLHALALIELNQLQQAESNLRRVLFLDREFVPAHYQLGLLLLSNKKIEEGLKSLTNALTIAMSKAPNDIVAASSGLTYGRLTEILKQEITLYTTTGTIKHGNKDAIPEN